MHVYIDESGGFICSPQTRVSAIGALAVPSGERDALFAAFGRLKRQISGTDAELKGSSLTERQVARVLSLLYGHGALFDTCIVDTGQERDDLVSRAKQDQADGILEFVTREFPARQVAELVGQRNDMLRLPNQLFLQMALTVKLIRRALETFINYHAQRNASELASFHWLIDAKAADLTPAERLWRDLILPMLHETTFSAFGWADYSFMNRHTVELPSSSASGEPLRGWSIRGILLDDLRFADSESDLGLQLVDIVTNALTRALNGRLGEEGWQPLGRLLVRRSEQTVQIWTLDPSADRLEHDYRPRFGPTLLRIESTARAMLQIPEGYTE